MQKQKERFNPIHSEHNLNIINSIFGALDRDREDNVIETHEVDFFPKFKFREVSELSIKLARMKDEDVKNIANDLFFIGQKHNLFSLCRSNDYRTIIHHAFKWLNNYYGCNTWIVYDQYKEEATANRTTINKLKFLDTDNGASRWTICFMPALERESPITFKFMCYFLNSCLKVGITSYRSDYSDMLFDFFIERVSDFDEEHKDEALNEIVSYKEGEPKRIMQLIQDHHVTEKELPAKFYEWEKNKDCFIPVKIVNEIEQMCLLIAQDISIDWYEKHERFDSCEGPESNCNAYALDWDNGHFQHDQEEYINMIIGERGIVELADSLVISTDRKESFLNKGHVLSQFLHLWNYNSIFNFFNDNYENLTSQADGAEICNRALQATKRTRKKPVRRASQNRKQRNTSRNTIHA